MIELGTAKMSQFIHKKLVLGHRPPNMTQMLTQTRHEYNMIQYNVDTKYINNELQFS